MSYRIIIDTTACTGFGACADADPRDFAVGRDGIAVGRPIAEDGRGALEAARACPMGAIRIVDETGAAVR
jgi:ferredoxin